MGLANALGLLVIAEGIEHDFQWDRLATLGCDYGQGYLFSRPLTSAQASLLIERRSVAPGATHALQS